MHWAGSGGGGGTLLLNGPGLSGAVMGGHCCCLRAQVPPPPQSGGSSWAGSVSQLSPIQHLRWRAGGGEANTHMQAQASHAHTHTNTHVCTRDEYSSDSSWQPPTRSLTCLTPHSSLARDGSRLDIWGWEEIDPLVMKHAHRVVFNAEHTMCSVTWDECFMPM